MTERPATDVLTDVLALLAHTCPCCGCCSGDDDYLDTVVRCFQATPRRLWPPIEGTEPFHERLRLALVRRY